MANKQDANFHKKTQFTSRNGVLDHCTQRHMGIITISIIIVIINYYCYYYYYYYYY